MSTECCKLYGDQKMISIILAKASYQMKPIPLELGCKLYGDKKMHMSNPKMQI